MTSETRQADRADAVHGDPASPGVLQATVGDIEEFNELVRGWNLDFRQLDRGTLSADLAQRAGRSSNVTRVGFDQAVAQAGGPPAGMRTFGIRRDRRPSMQWCRQAVEPDALLCFHPSDEFQCLSPRGFSVFSLSIEETLLASTAERLGHPGLFDEMQGELAVDASATAELRELRRLLPRMFEAPELGATRAPEAEIAVLERAIVEELVVLVAGARCDAEPMPLTDRARAVGSAVSYIFDHAQEALQVADVCEATGVSWRTLDRAFQEQLGTGPKRCISGVRLRGVRRALRAAEPEARVTDIANEWGYWHMGDFAMNYRREFGELPSEALYAGSSTPAKGRCSGTVDARTL